jgi:hypothetical protein
LQNTFIKAYIYQFLTNIFIEIISQSWHFEDRVAVLNDMFYKYGRSMRIKISLWPNVTIHSTEYLKFSTIHFTMGAICIVHIW